MSLLGAIKEIGELELAISLPNGLTGYVHIAEISPYVTAQVEHVAAQEGDDISLPNLAEIFRVGDFVRCVITELGRTETNRNRIDLSINPQKVNLGITADDLVSNMVRPPPPSDVCWPCNICVPLHLPSHTHTHMHSCTRL